MNWGCGDDSGGGVRWGGGGDGGAGYLELKEQKLCDKTEETHVEDIRCTQIRNFYVMPAGWTEGSRPLHNPGRK